MLAKLWVAENEVSVTTEVVVSQYNRNLPSRCFASAWNIDWLYEELPSGCQEILPASFIPASRKALSSLSSSDWILTNSDYKGFFLNDDDDTSLGQ